MSQAFPTHKQFAAAIRARLKAEYPEATREQIADTVGLQAAEQKWLEHLGQQITAGVKAELPVLDSLNKDQLYNLKKHYAPFEALDWYLPADLRRRTTLTPETLFAYARKFAKKHEDAGDGTQYPTFGVAARHFRVRIAAIEEAISDYMGSGYMAAAVGGRTGNGYFVYDRKADYQVEAY